MDRRHNHNKSSVTSPPLPLTSVPASIEEAAQYAQRPQFPDQRWRLGTDRQVSSIPRPKVEHDNDDTITITATTTTTTTTTTNDNNHNTNDTHQNACPVTSSSSSFSLPHHQPRGGSSSLLFRRTNHTNNQKEKDNHHDHNNHNNLEYWVYPSEQQLYNAMRRKGYHHVPETSVAMVLHIHNSVNERTWRHVQEWEHGIIPTPTTTTTTNTTPPLILQRFHGRPHDLSPKAWWLCRVLRWYPLPFDRHDWYVVSSSSSSSSTTTTTRTQRYVIDYYADETRDPPGVPVTRVDVRPAWDDPFRTAYLYARRFAHCAFPGIAAALARQRARALARADHHQENHHQEE